MTRSARHLVAIVSLAVGVVSAVAAETVDLKVTRIAIFSSGVGHFACDATVADTGTAELRFRTDQVNDILKSLVVQDFDGGSVNTIGYASRDPIEKTLKSFGVDIADKPTLAGLLDRLRGEPIEIAMPRAVQGVVLGVEKQRIPQDKGSVEVDVLNILADGSLHQVRLSEVQGIKLTNKQVAGELQNALASVASSHDANKKTVTIRFEGKGRRRIQVSYLLEAPIWKTSYRLILAADKKPLLQGWATVENATEDDWKDVRLALVSGRPISFTVDLYTPLYVPRPHEELELYASLRPPTLEAAMEKPPAAAPPPPPSVPASAREGTPAEDGAQARGYGSRRGGGMGGYGGAGMLGGYGGGAMGIGGAGVASVAATAEAGELFEYAIRTPVSIGRQRSAMLPIVNEQVAIERVSIFNPDTHPTHPLNGLYLQNKTTLNLMQGPVAVFDADTYAGDAKLPDLKPGDKRLVAYALDLAVDVNMPEEDEEERPAEMIALRIVRGTAWTRHKEVDDHVYRVTNRDSKDRTVLIEQGHNADWKLVEPKEPFEQTADLWRFKVVVPAGKTVEQTVRTERVEEESVVLSSAESEVFGVYLKSRVLSAGVRKAIEKVVAMRTEADRVADDRAAREKEMKESVGEQGRVRENLKTLQQNSDPYQRQLKKFDALETQIEQLRSQAAELRKEEEKKRAALQDYLASLDVE